MPSPIILRDAGRVLSFERLSVEQYDYGARVRSEYLVVDAEQEGPPSESLVPKSYVLVASAGRYQLYHDPRSRALRCEPESTSQDQ
jgi:hypothetical protein